MTPKKILMISILSIGAGSLILVPAITVPLVLNSQLNNSNNDNLNPPSSNPENNKPPIGPDNPNKIWGDPNAPKGITSLPNSLGRSVAAHPDDKDNAIIITKDGPKTDMEGKELVGSKKGYIVNETYLNMAKRSVSLNFYDGYGPHMGTGWILDYKLPEQNNTYPLTWYFATNAHVAYNLVVSNDYNGYNTYYNEPSINRTKELRLRNIKDPKTKTEYVDSNRNEYLYNEIKVPIADIVHSNGSAEYVYRQNSPVKTIFIANDFLKSDPIDYNKDEIWKNIKETVDFAVIEVTFENENDAKTITNDYVNWKKEDQFKIADSLLKENNIKENDYFTFGYPNAKGSGYDPDAIEIYSNSRKDVDTNNPPNHGSSLSGSKYYSSFETEIPNSKGIFDGVLNFSWFYQPNPFTKENFLYWGLFYTLRHDDLPEGASGSMMMNSKKETLGIQFAYDNTTDYGIIQALRSEGYNFNGKYKWYNHEPYDLVYGGFENQKKSYKDYLFKAKGNNYKTHLFPNGNI